MDLLLSTLTGAQIIQLACQPTAQRPMLVQASLILQATNQGDTGEELTLVVAERRLRLVTTTRSLTTTTIAFACAAAAAPDDSAGNKSPPPGFALEHSGLLCCSAALVLCSAALLCCSSALQLAISAQGVRPPLC